MSEFYAADTATVRSKMDYLKGAAKNVVETKINQASTFIQTGVFDNPLAYSETCITLGRTIDSAIAVNVCPSSSHLPQLLLTVREVCRLMTELQQPSLMLLMLPIKAACQFGWFSDGDKADLLRMADKVCNVFSDTDKMSIEPSYAHSCVSNIILRFYPTLKVENILTSFNVKAGFGTYVVDFHISHGTLPPHCRNLWLLVARVDNLDTAACIASPANVDFLINGSGVPKRTKSNMGKGPQFPSNVTRMIKFGVNLLQVLGDFDGEYVIAVAFMNLNTSPDVPALPNYVHTTSSVESSLVSLDCPISKLRIKTPVKGHLCKHPQCFDYKYFMEVNSRWPTWNCPVCNKPVCNLDIRMDQKFLKILNEAAEHVHDVVVSADGSWTVGTELQDQTAQDHSATSTTGQAQSTSMHAPPTTSSPLTVVAAFEQLMRGGQQHNYTGLGLGLGQSQPGPSSPSQPVDSSQSQPIRHGPSQNQTVGPGQSQRVPSVRPASGSGRMRGSLRGDQLAEARDRLLAPPRQPVRANEPWSRPTPTLPIALLIQQNTTNSDNTPNVSK